MKRIISLLLALVLCFGAIPFFSTEASAATSSAVATAVSNRLPIVTYAMPLSGASKVYSYSDSTLSTKTTGYYIDSFKDQIVITKISSNGKALYVTYPSTSSSTGYRSRWFAADDILGLASVSVQYYTCSSKNTTYRMSSASGVASYGSISAGDACAKLGKHIVGGKTYYPTIYPISSGTYNKVSGVRYKLAMNCYAPSSTSSTSSSFWQWPMEKNSNGYRVTQSFNHYSSSMASKGRPYHAGIDMVCTDKVIRAAANGVVVYRGYSNGNGNHIVLKHTFNGKTVYSLYSHLADFTGCPSVNSSVSKGARIGTMGNTGNSTGAHLHFAIYTGGSTDPLGYVKNSGANSIYYTSTTTFYNPAYVIEKNALP